MSTPEYNLLPPFGTTPMVKGFMSPCMMDPGGMGRPIPNRINQKPLKTLATRTRAFSVTFTGDVSRIHHLDCGSETLR